MPTVTDAEAAHYLSTACLHRLHTECRRECKFCRRPCNCDCHASDRWTRLNETAPA